VYTSVTRTHLRWDGRDLVVYNLHLRTFGEKKPWNDEKAPIFKAADLVPYLRRYREAYRVRAWEVDQIIEMLEEETMPVIVLGDLNSTPHNWVMGRITDKLRDTFDEAGNGWGMTYHTRFPIFRIDYVLVSDEFEVVSADVIDAYLSDHLPLVVKLRWRE
jgi:endonuclease/exonuclease/phosphatase family metal-dependent hydrolase